MAFPTTLGSPSAFSSPFSHMLWNNMLAYPVETVTTKTISNVENVTDATLNNYAGYFLESQNPVLLPSNSKILNLANPIPITSFTPASVALVGINETLNNDARYTNTISYDNYNISGKIAQTTLNSSLNKAYIWGYNNQYPIAEAKNAPNNEIYYEGFEEPTLSQWGVNVFTIGGIGAPLYFDQTNKHTGEYVGRVDNTNPSGEMVSHSNKWLTIALTDSKKFHYSGWVYSNGPSVDIFLFMKRAGETGYFSYVSNVSTSKTNEWVYLEKDFEVPDDVTSLSIRVDANSLGSVWFDDLRIHPTDAQMTTYTYKSLVGITSSTDPSGRTINYEYDGFNRLMNIKEQNGHIIKNYQYNYKP